MAAVAAHRRAQRYLRHPGPANWAAASAQPTAPIARAAGCEFRVELEGSIRVILEAEDALRFTAAVYGDDPDTA